MKQKLSYAVLAVFIISFFGFLSIIIPDTVSAQTARGFCCLDGKLTPSIAPKECQEKGGRFFTNLDEAKKMCKPVGCFCCINGELTEAPSPEACKEKKGVCYSNKDDAVKRCQKSCFCCINGQVNEIAQAACKARNGVCYTTKVDAVQRCQKPK